MRNPNGYGSVYKLKGRRRRPWIARVTTGWTTAIAMKGKYKGQEVARQTYQTIGYFKTKQEAMDALALHRVNPIPPKADITLEELYKEWSESKYKHISKSTKNNYKAAWKYIKRFEKAKFKDIRTAQWQSVIDKCDDDKLSQSTLKKIKTVAVMLSDHALQNDIINKNYAEFIEIPKSEKAKKDRFTDIEVKKIEDAADTAPWADTVLILIYTGMRISEMLQLTRFNVNLELQLITGGVKTDAGKDRIIPIHPKIQKYIKAWYDNGGDALITHKEGKAIRTKYYREKYYYPVLKEIGVRKLTPHKCRHTFGSLMAEAGVDTIYIQQIIGHTDYAFTANEYTHPEIEKLRQAIGKI
jgi:integrase